MDTTQIIIIAAAVGGGIVLLIAIVALVYWYKQRQKFNYSPIDDYLESVAAQRPRSVPVEEKQQSALMNARFYLRSSNYDLKDPLYEIGCRANKYHFHVRKQRNDYLLGIVPRGKHCRLALHSNATRINVRAVLCSLRHPYVLPTLEADFLPGRDLLLTFRPFSKKDGSLRDRIHRTKPHKRHIDKYNRGTALKPKQIATYGRQIIEGLLFFQLHDYPYPHLHSGNVIIWNGRCCLSDYENSLMGLKPYLSIISLLSTATPEVLAFGCVLYEMATGSELEELRQIKRLPTTCPEAVREILESIFLAKPEAATLEGLTLHPFFDVAVEPDPDETDITAELASCIKQAGPGDGSAPTRPKKKKKGSRRRLGDAGSPRTGSSVSSASTSVSSSVPSSSVASTSMPMSPSVGSPAPRAPPPPAMSSPAPPVSAPGRQGLLSDIRRGASLKKAETNDRSAPKV